MTDLQTDVLKMIRDADFFVYIEAAYIWNDDKLTLEWLDVMLEHQLFVSKLGC